MGSVNREQMEEKKMEYYFGIRYNSTINLNDSIELIKEWGTADVYRFASKQARDEWAYADVLQMPISEEDANRIGFEDYDD